VQKLSGRRHWMQYSIYNNFNEQIYKIINVNKHFSLIQVLLLPRLKPTGTTPAEATLQDVPPI
jgi:hypothetical protein